MSAIEDILDHVLSFVQLLIRVNQLYNLSDCIYSINRQGSCVNKNMHIFPLSSIISTLHSFVPERRSQWPRNIVISSGTCRLGPFPAANCLGDQGLQIAIR